jgi:hypothetical protein
MGEKMRGERAVVRQHKGFGLGGVVGCKEL